MMLGFDNLAGVNSWWVVYVIVAIGYLLLILYVANAKKARLAEDVEQRSDSSFTATIAREINSAHVQQFLANEITVLRTFLNFQDKIKLDKIPELSSAFPRRVRDEVLEEEQLEKAVEAVALNTELTKKDVIRYIQHDKDIFLRTQQRLAVNRGFQKIDISGVVKEIERSHPEFNAFEILHKEGLGKICEREELQLVPFQEMELLAAIIQYKDSDSNSRRHAILVKEGADVHPALEEFVLAHEIGHWFAHLKHGQLLNLDYGNSYLHSFQDSGPFENEADKIAMIALFPTPYLSWRDVLGELSEDFLFDQFTSNKDWKPVNEKLESIMRANIGRRIVSYQNYRNLKLQQLNLGTTALREATIQHLRHDVLKNHSWARLDLNNKVVEANEKYAQLFNLSVEALISGSYDIVGDLTSKRLQENMRKQLWVKRKLFKPMFYITEYKHPTTHEPILVTIYAFPIVDDNDHYSGALGVVTDKRNGI